VPQRTTFRWDGAAALAAIREGAATGLELGMEHLLGESNRLVPLDEGTLERSGRAQVDRAELVGAVSYDTVYAIRQHEEMTWRHLPGRQAKYLEQPAHSEAPTIQAIIAESIRTATEGG